MEPIDPERNTPTADFYSIKIGYEFQASNNPLKTTNSAQPLICLMCYAHS